MSEQKKNSGDNDCSPSREHVTPDEPERARAGADGSCPRCAGADVSFPIDGITSDVRYTGDAHNYCVACFERGHTYADCPYRRR